MRVMAVVHYPVFGGPHNLVARLCAPLASRGIELRVALPEGPGNAAEWMRAAGVPVDVIPLRRIRATRDLRTHLRFVAAFPGDVVRIGRLVRRHRADVVLLPGLINPHGAIAGRLLGKAVVWQVLDTFTPAPATRILMPLVDRLADAAMFWGQALVEAHGDPQLRVPVVLASGAVDTKEFRPSASRRRGFRDELDIPLDAVVVGMVANWVPIKGVHVFLEAARALAERHPSTWFVVVGSPQPGSRRQYADEVRELASSSPDLRERVRLAPGRPDLETVYPAYDVMVVPSLSSSEGLATTALEAMSCGLPVVATDVGATSDAVIEGQTGRLVSPGASGALIDALDGFITMEAEERRRLGMQARDVAVERYDVEVAARTHETAFQAALQHSQRRIVPRPSVHWQWR